MYRCADLIIYCYKLSVSVLVSLYIATNYLPCERFSTLLFCRRESSLEHSGIFSYCVILFNLVITVRFCLHRNLALSVLYNSAQLQTVVNYLVQIHVLHSVYGEVVY